MKLKFQFYAEITYGDWLYMAAVSIIILLVLQGDKQTAIQTLTEWLKLVKWPQ